MGENLNLRCYLVDEIHPKSVWRASHYRLEEKWGRKEYLKHAKLEAPREFKNLDPEKDAIEYDK